MISRRHFIKSLAAAAVVVATPARHFVPARQVEMMPAFPPPSHTYQEFCEFLLRDIADGIGIPRAMLEDLAKLA